MYSIKVIWKNGEEEFAKAGNGLSTDPIAQFNTRKEAAEMADFMKQGMDEGEYQSVNIVSPPLKALTEAGNSNRR